MDKHKDKTYNHHVWFHVHVNGPGHRRFDAKQFEYGTGPSTGAQDCEQTTSDPTNLQAEGHKEIQTNKTSNHRQGGTHHAKPTRGGGGAGLVVAAIHELVHREDFFAVQVRAEWEWGEETRQDRVQNPAQLLRCVVRADSTRIRVRGDDLQQLGVRVVD